MWRRDGYSEKKITPSRLSTLPTLCWTQKGILTSPYIISKLSCFPIWGSFFPASFFFFCYWQSSERPLSATAEKWPKRSLRVFLSNISREKKKNNLHLNISLRLRIVPVPHWTIYCCWLGQQGGVVFGVTVLQPEDLDSISRDSWNPPCWGALRIHGYKDAALKRRRTVNNAEKAQKCTRTPSKWLSLILFVCTKSTRMFPLWFFSRGVEILHRCFIKHSALVCISEGSRLTELPLKLYLITQKSKPPPEAVKEQLACVNR